MNYEIHGITRNTIRACFIVLYCGLLPMDNAYSLQGYVTRTERVMMTSSNGNIFRVTDPLCGEFTSLRWIPRTKASDAELWCFLWFASVETVK